MQTKNKSAESTAQKKHPSGIQKLEIDTPVIINNLIITPKLLEELDWLQTGGSVHLGDARYNNDGIILRKQYVSKTIIYVLGQMARNLHDEPGKEETEILLGLQWLYHTLESMEVPEELKG